MTDPIADMLTRVRNALRAGHRTVEIPSSRMKVAIAEILKEERFITNYRVITDGKQGMLKVYLRYLAKGEGAIEGIERVSKPGLRVYVGKDGIPKICGGFGIAILSTSRGVFTDKRARRLGIGGEVVCKVW
jgi:small subunit ribosomal protein S8